MIAEQTVFDELRCIVVYLEGIPLTRDIRRASLWELRFQYSSFGFIHFAFAAGVCVGSRSTPLFDT